MAGDRNILLVGNYPPPYGGVPLHIERLTKFLHERGWNCHVLSGGSSGREVIDGVTVYRPTLPRKLLMTLLPQPTAPLREWLNDGKFDREERMWWRRYRPYAGAGREIIRRENIQVIASYNLLTYAPIGAWLAREFGLPHIITNFGEVFKFASMTRSSAFFRNVADEAFRLVSCSEHCGRSLQKLGIRRRVEAVTYGIALDRFAPGEYPAALRERLGIAPGPVILFVGRLGAEMGLDSFLASARLIADRHPDAKFLMVGQAADLADEAERECAASGGRMMLVRNAPYDELPLYYRLADMLVVPTRGDRTCSSLAGMEAMATRVAVAGFAIGGIPEIVEDGVTGLLVPPEDVAKLADAIDQLLTDEALRQRLAAAGYARALAYLGEDRMNERMERHFLDALETR